MSDRIVRGLIIAGVMLSVALAAVFARSRGLIGEETMIRAVTAPIGIVLALNASLGTKRVQRTARAIAVNRVAGWSFVFGGLAYAAAWVFAPFALALPLSIAGVALGFAAVFGYCFLTRPKTSA